MKTKKHFVFADITSSFCLKMKGQKIMKVCTVSIRSAEKNFELNPFQQLKIENSITNHAV